MTSNDYGLMMENSEQSSEVSVDRLSQFPNDILTIVLSCLPLKDTGRTSVLSHCWRNLWQNTSRLNFEPEGFTDRIAETYRIPDKKALVKEERFSYVEWVTNVLLNCEGKTHVLEEFRVRFDLDKTWQCVIKMLLKHAFAKKVRRLELDLSSMTPRDRHCGENCVFPDEVLTKEHPYPISAQVLKDRYEMKITLESLEALCLKSVNVSGEALDLFLRNCTSLEELVVWRSNKLTELEVSGRSLKLKLLEIQNCRELVSLKVRNTNLRSLTLGKLRGAAILLEDLPMLVNVSLTSTRTDLYTAPTGFYTGVFRILKGCISQLEVLNLDGGKPKEIKMVDEFPHLTKLKKLVLKFWADKNNNFVDLVSFVKAAPMLEEFILELKWQKPLENKEQVEIAEATTHTFLKVLHISGYCGRTGELQLVKYLLQNAVALERIIVDPRMLRQTTHNRQSPEVEMANEEKRTLIKEQLAGQVPGHIQLVVL